MDQNERTRLKKQYELYADEQILAMLADGPEAFVEGAYALLEQEAESRGLTKETIKKKIVAPDKDIPPVEQEHPQIFIEIVIINSVDDRRLVESALEPTDISYNFLNISVTAKDMPVALVVEDKRVEDAVGILSRLSLTGSIVLW